MCVPSDGRAESARERRPRLRRLLPRGDDATAAEIVTGLGLWERPAAQRSRPRVMLNMISTADGRATLNGRSGPLSNSADRQLFHGLRSAVDGVLVGAATVRAERYGRIIPDASTRALRQAHGLSEEPLACIVSGRLELEPSVPLLAEPAARVAILTASLGSLQGTAANVEYVRTGHEGAADLPAALAELSERFAVQSLLCEGGPHLACQLLADGLVDELFLSLAPLLAGGEAAPGETLRILAGSDLEPPVRLALLGVMESEATVFLRYGVSA